MTAEDTFMGAGIVFAAWGAIGVVVGQFWAPAALLAIPAMIWISIFVTYLAVGAPYVWARQRLNRPGD